MKTQIKKMILDGKDIIDASIEAFFEPENDKERTILEKDLTKAFKDLIRQLSETYTRKVRSETTEYRGAYYEAVIKKLDERRTDLKEVLGQVDIDGLKKGMEGTSFGNILFMCHYDHILTMETKEGYDDRVDFVNKRPDKFKDYYGKPIVWNYDYENSLAAENKLSKTFVDIFKKNGALKDWKYDNVFQFVSKQSAFEDVDIKLDGSDSDAKGFIELKGAKAGHIKFNKFVYMAKYYKEKGADYFYAMGRAKVPSGVGKDEQHTYTDFRIDVIPTQLLKILTKDSIYKSIKDMAKAPTANADKIQKIMKVIATCLNYTVTTGKDIVTKETYFAVKLPDYAEVGNSLTINKNLKMDDFKEHIKKLKGAKVKDKDDIKDVIKKIINNQVVTDRDWKDIPTYVTKIVTLSAREKATVAKAAELELPDTASITVDNIKASKPLFVSLAAKAKADALSSDEKKFVKEVYDNQILNYFLTKYNPYINKLDEKFVKSQLGANFDTKTLDEKAEQLKKLASKK